MPRNSLHTQSKVDPKGPFYSLSLLTLPPFINMLMWMAAVTVHRCVEMLIHTYSMCFFLTGGNWHLSELVVTLR